MTTIALQLDWCPDVGVAGGGVLGAVPAAVEDYDSCVLAVGLGAGPFFTGVLPLGELVAVREVFGSDRHDRALPGSTLGSR